MANHKSCRLNVLAKDVDNAAELVKATDGNIYIGIMMNKFASVEEAAAIVGQYQEAGAPVSVGLGAGDPAQWEKVAKVALQTNPAHVNQVFPAAGYTAGVLKFAGNEATVVNALIAPTGIAGKVNICTGVNSGRYQEMLSCDAAAALLEDVGVKSIKFYPMDGVNRLAEAAAMVKAAVRHGIVIFEPTGGVDAQCVKQIVDTCLENGAQTVIPHIYTALVDKTTGITHPEQVAAVYRSLGQ